MVIKLLFINKAVNALPYYINMIPLRGTFIVLQYELRGRNPFMNSLEARTSVSKNLNKGRIKPFFLIQPGLSFNPGRSGTGYSNKSI